MENVIFSVIKFSFKYNENRLEIGPFGLKTIRSRALVRLKCHQSRNLFPFALLLHKASQEKDKTRERKLEQTRWQKQCEWWEESMKKGKLLRAELFLDVIVSDVWIHSDRAAPVEPLNSGASWILSVVGIWSIYICSLTDAADMMIMCFVLLVSKQKVKREIVFYWIHVKSGREHVNAARQYWTTGHLLVICQSINNLAAYLTDSANYTCMFLCCSVADVCFRDTFDTNTCTHIDTRTQIAVIPYNLCQPSSKSKWTLSKCCF